MSQAHFVEVMITIGKGIASSISGGRNQATFEWTQHNRLYLELSAQESVSLLTLFFDFRCFHFTKPNFQQLSID